MNTQELRAALREIGLRRISIHPCEITNNTFEVWMSQRQMLLVQRFNDEHDSWEIWRPLDPTNNVATTLAKVKLYLEKETR